MCLKFLTSTVEKIVKLFVSSKFMNQEIQMYNLVVWIMMAQLTRNDCEGFSEVIYITCIVEWH